jgi:hypothetical protein
VKERWSDRVNGEEYTAQNNRRHHRGEVDALQKNKVQEQGKGLRPKERGKRSRPTEALLR